MVQADHAAAGAFMQRFGNIDRRLRAIEAFMASINSTSAYAGQNITTASTSYVATSPACAAVATCGMSGNFVVIASATVTVNSGATASIGLFESGTLLVNPFLSLENNTYITGASTGQIGAPGAAVNVIGGFTPYTFKTFELRYKTSTNSIEATFGNPIITIIPV